MTTQFNDISTTLDQTRDANPKYTKRGIIHSLFNFLFGDLISSADIESIKNNMAILEENQDVLSNQMLPLLCYLLFIKYLNINKYCLHGYLSRVLKYQSIQVLSLSLIIKLHNQLSIHV